MAGFDNEVMYANNVDFTGNAAVAGQVTTNGQLLIGSTAAPNIRVGTLTAGQGVSITNGAGSITVAFTNVLAYTATAVSYVVLTTDMIIDVTDTSAARTITLPASPSTGQAFIVKDSGGQASTNPISVVVSGGVKTIDGSSSFSINSSYGSNTFIYNGTNYLVI